MSEATIAKKAAIVEEVTEKFNAAASVVIVDYRGLTVDEVTRLRKQLREANVEMKVIKNSILSRAAKAAGLKKIPAIVKDYTDNRKKQVALIENIQREDLNIVEIAKAVKELMDIDGYTQSEVAKITGKNVSTISNIVRLLKLPNQVLDMVLNGDLVEGQARALLAINDEKKQIEIAKKVAEKKLTVRDVERLIYGDEKYQRKTEKKKPKSVYYQNVENKLKDYFGYKVKIDQTKRHQRLIIEYNDEEGLESLLSMLNIDM